jgi:hypothetical protein
MNSIAAEDKVRFADIPILQRKGPCNGITGNDFLSQV